MTLGELCDLLAQANIHIYKYENLKWWGRKQKKASVSEINKWDKLSRTWNEKRSLLKNQIDKLLKQSSSVKTNIDFLVLAIAIFLAIPVPVLLLLKYFIFLR